MLSDDKIKELAAEYFEEATDRKGRVEYSTDIYGLIDCARAIEAECAKVPEGWVAVPKEPTEKILEWFDPGFGTRREAYAAMLAAAPKPAQAEKQEPVKDEPVAWVAKDGCLLLEEDRESKIDAIFLRNWKPLYTRPQPEMVKDEPVFEVGFGWLQDADKFGRGTKLYTRPQPEPAKGEPIAWCVAYDDPRMGRIHSDPSMCKPELEALISRASSQLALVPLYTRPQPENTLWQTTAKSLGAEVDKLTAEVERLRNLSVCEACIEIPSVGEYVAQCEQRIAELEEAARQALEAFEQHDGNYKLSKASGAVVEAAIAKLDAVLGNAEITGSEAVRVD